MGRYSTPASDRGKRQEFQKNIVAELSLTLGEAAPKLVSQLAYQRLSVRKLFLRHTIAAMLALASGLATADDLSDVPNTTPSGAAMAFDLVIVRPVSLLATVLGTGLFVLQLPLSVVQGVPPGDPARKLVLDPARYTFSRPLGQMN